MLPILDEIAEYYNELWLPYSDMWDKTYQDGSEDIVPMAVFWPFFLALMVLLLLWQTPSIIKYACGTKKRYIASIEEQAAKIMKE